MRMTWLIFALMTVASWGLYGVFLHTGQMSMTDIETYICNKLHEIFWKFPKEIVPNTTFGELERYHELYFVDPGLLIYIEEDLGVYLPDEEALALDNEEANVGALVDAVVRHRLTVAEEVRAGCDTRQH